MGIGIIVCGLNGCGKSTLGKALAEKLKFHFIDDEHLYFSKSDKNYACPRTKKEAEKLLLKEVSTHENFVFAAVKANYCEEFTSLLKYAVLIEVPATVRAERIRNRSFLKFGNRMLEGGDMYESEERFFAVAASRSEDEVKDGLKNVLCTLIRVDGTKPIGENAEFILKTLSLQ